MSFGDRLRELREAKGYRQEDIGRVLHLGKSAISLWESGKRVPDMHAVQRLADFFGVSVDYLLGRTDNPSLAGGVPVPPPWFQKLSPELQAKLGDDRLRNAYFRILNKATLNDLPPETLEVIVESYLEARKLDEEARKAKERKAPEDN